MELVYYPDDFLTSKPKMRIGEVFLLFHPQNFPNSLKIVKLFRSPYEMTDFGFIEAINRDELKNQILASGNLVRPNLSDRKGGFPLLTCPKDIFEKARFADGDLGLQEIKSDGNLNADSALFRFKKYNDCKAVLSSRIIIGSPE